MATRTMTTQGGDATSVDAEGTREDDFLVPVLHLRVPARLVKAGFLGGLAAAVLLDAVDIPVAALLAVGVAVARHRRA